MKCVIHPKEKATTKMYRVVCPMGGPIGKSERVEIQTSNEAYPGPVFFRRTFVGPCPHRFRDHRIGSNFWKFYLIRTGFTLGEPVSLVKVFRLFRSKQIFLVQSVDIVFRCTTSYPLARPACL
jgi:hypothetical protein